MARSAAAWTDAQDSLLVADYPARGPEWCADRLGRSSTAVQARASRIGVKRARRNMGHVKMSLEQMAEAVRMYVEDGASAQTIADRYGVKYDCIYNVLRANGVERDTTGTRNRRWTDDEEREIVADYLGGMTQTQVAEKWRTRQGAIHSVLKRCGATTRYKKREFTEDEIDEIVQRYLDGEAAATIAPDFGVFHKRLISLLKRAGVPIRVFPSRPDPWTDCRGREFKFRSSWEVLTAQWLDSNNYAWDYEVECYRVAVDGKSLTYLPDFWIYNSDGSLHLIVDVKGRWWVRSQERKIAVFKEQYSLPFEVWFGDDLLDKGILPSGILRTRSPLSANLTLTAIVISNGGVVRWLDQQVLTRT